jgi:type IV pilus assembly protein PilB
MNHLEDMEMEKKDGSSQIKNNSKRLGEILVDQNFITLDQLAMGIERQKISKKRLGEILTELGFVTEEKLARALSLQLEKPTAEGVPPIVKTKKLGQILLDLNLITKDQLNKCLEEKKRTNKKMGEILTELGYVSEEKLAQALSAQLGIPYVDLSNVVVEPEAIELLRESIARKNLAIPLSVDKKFITVAMADPLDFEGILDISFVTGREVKPMVAPLKEIKAAIRRFYHLAQPLQKILGEIKDFNIEVIAQEDKNQPSEGLEEGVRRGESPPIIRMVNSIIVHAVRNNASDIHFEPKEKYVKVRERIDGILMEAFEFPKLVQGSVTSRIKIMARMDITEKSVPQDGRIRIKMEGRDLDLRVATLPTHYGEKITIRILDSQAVRLKLRDILVDDRDYQKVLDIIERPQGIVLTTGPTGSGKTSTQYGMINHIKSEKINLITLEDPIEYELQGVNQVAINEKVGLTFASSLRSVLRQDPDVIMVGEMRDNETASIAIEASLTGHLVLSTLHTNTAVAAITRLRNLGISPYLIASSLNGVIAQRLLRRICEKCKAPYALSPEEVAKIRLRGRDPSIFKNLYKGKGCTVCNHTGYRGRIAVFEILVVNGVIRDLIAQNASEDAILRAALAGGMKLLSVDAIEKINQGITTVDELFRVLYLKDEEGPQVCGTCGEFFQKDLPGCPKCGNIGMEKCPVCGGAREEKWKFCPFCGESYHNRPFPFALSAKKAVPFAGGGRIGG